MPILPDVNREMNMNVQRLADTSGAEQAASVYGAIGQLSQNVGNIATQVARDLHTRAGSLEAQDKLSKYQLETSSYLDTLRKDDTQDFISNSKEIEDTFRARQQQRRTALLDGADSMYSRSILEEQLNTAESEEALKLLDVKSKRIASDSDAYIQRSMNSFGQTVGNPDADVDFADIAYKKTTNSLYQVFSPHMSREDIQKMNTRFADDGIDKSSTAMILKGNVKALSEKFFGPTSAILAQTMDSNFRSGKNVNAGVGIRNESKPGVYNVTNPDGTTKELQVGLEDWKKSEMVIDASITGGKENKFITSVTPQGMLADVSPQMRGAVFNRIFQALNKKPKEDSSLERKKLASATALLKDGKLPVKAYEDITSDAVISKFDAAKLSDVASIIIGMNTQNFVNSIPDNKLARQKDLVKFVDDNWEKIAQKTKDDPKFTAVATKLADIYKTDVDSAKSILMDQLSTQKLRDQIVDTATRKSEALKTLATKDIAAAAQSRMEIPDQVKGFNDFLFTQGGILQPGAMRSQAGQNYKDFLAQRKEKAAELSDTFGLKNNPLTEEQVAGLKSYLSESYSDSGKLTNIIDNLRDMFVNSPSDFTTLMVEQLKMPILAHTIMQENYTALHDTVRAAKYFDANASRMQNDSTLTDFKKAVFANDDIKKVQRILSQSSNSAEPQIAADIADNIFKLSVYYKNNRIGLSDDEAIKMAADTLIFKDNDVLLTTPGTFSKGAGYYSVIHKKAEGVDAQKLQDTLDSTVGNIDWLLKENIPLPKEVAKDEEFTRMGRQRFLEYVVKNKAARNSAMSGGVDLGFNYKGRFIPLPDGEGGFLKISLNDVKFVNKKVADKEVTQERMDVEIPGDISGRRTVLSKRGWYNVDERNKVAKEISGKKTQNSLDFANNPTDEDVKGFNELENANIEKNYNKIYDTTLNGVRARTLGGSMTSMALEDVLNKRGIDTSKMSADEVFATAQKSIKSPSDFYEMQKEYMRLNRHAIQAQLRKVSGNPSAMQLLSDMSMVLGAGAINKYRLGEVLAISGPKELEKILNSELPYVKDRKGTTITMKQAFKGNIEGNQKRYARYKSWMKLI